METLVEPKTYGLVKCLHEDIIFVQYFNCFLSLPSFPTQLVYNIVSGSFEQFHNTLADDVNGEGNVKEAATLKQRFDYFKTTINERSTRLGYYVKVLEKENGLQWVLNNRLDLFLRSEIYADYKLSKRLAKAQVAFLRCLIKEHVPMKSYDTVSSNIKDAEEETFSLTVNSPTAESKVDLSTAISPTPEISLSSEKQSRANSSESTSCKSMSLLIPARRVSQPLSPSIWEFFPDVITYLSMLYRDLTNLKSVEEWKKWLSRQGNNFTNIQCENEVIYEVMWYTEQLNEKSKEEIVVEQSIREYFEKTPESFPINLLFNEGLSAFKEFLCDTSGEKHLMLWIDLERCRNLKEVAQKRYLPHIKERYLQPSSPNHFSAEFINLLTGERDISKMSIADLFDKQDMILEPLLNYWCQRFTIHQYRQKIQLYKQTLNVPPLVSSTLSTPFPMNEFSSRNLPLRPLSCKYHIQVMRNPSTAHDSKQQKELTDSVFNDSDSGIFSEDGLDVSITRRKLRSKSAHPRLVSSRLTRNTNAGQKQLQLATSFLNEGFGFKAPSPKYYPNDASDSYEKKSVRLFIQPVPSLNASASTIQSKPNFSEEDDMEERFQFEKDLDSLVEILLHERHSGYYFLKFLQKQNNQIWLNCYHFWHALQEYNEFFFADSFSPQLVKRKANFIYTTHIISNSANYIKCPENVQEKIYRQLDPPFEDLYTAAEKHALDVLVQPWSNLIMAENKEYANIHKDEHLKYIEVNRTHTWRYLIEEEDFKVQSEEEDENEEYEDKISPEEVEKPLPVANDLNFDSLIRNKVELEHFQSFLETRHKQGIMDLTAWTDMEVFRRLPQGNSEKIKEIRAKKAMEIREKWLNKNYFFGSNTPATKGAVKKVLEISGGEKSIPPRPSSPTISEAQKYTRARVERRWLILFKQTKEYLERRKQKDSVTEIVEDLLMKKKIQRSEHAWRLLNTRWNSNSRDVASLRVALSDPEECEHFRKFIKVRGEMMENNLNFWLEVQKYKELCHHHVQPALIKNKLQAIVHVYIKSDIPPELQIDIPIEIADRLYEKVYGRSQQHGPYIFREAQTTILRIMFNHWKDFIEFRAQNTDLATLRQSLQELEGQYRKDIMRKKFLVERRRLSKLVIEKRKREHMSNERGKVKPHQDLFSVMADTINLSDSELEYDTTKFSYSKQQADEELKLLEAKIRGEGLIPDELETRKSVLSGYTQKEKSKIESDQNSTALKTPSQKTSSIHTNTTMKTMNTNKKLKMPKRRMSFFNTVGALEMRKMHLGPAYDKCEEMKDMKIMDKTLNDLETKTRLTRFYQDPNRFRYDTKSGVTQKTKSKKSRRSSKDKKKALDQVSCVSDLPFIKTTEKDGEEEKKKKKSETLTKKSLKAFEKTPQGKPLKNPLQFVKTVSTVGTRLYSRSKTFPEITYDLINDDQESFKTQQTNHRKEKPRKEIKLNPRLPHNAGTAAIILQKSKEARFIESPPPVIEAEVVVC